ncbi:hypothetical protein FF011L_22960 [Roseimaritima multifibrata]|uniref:Cytochrome c domain-containing protein n=1 Tax=Roseimaritima multifibrata TaxID=1930274 RepID=A0A517MFA3_9BACT|nr:hypothetical protein [Roseimaritima multifibrata]QDS93526.1 hypothetical protein FF011L_22960 [Roseimaritima multifibrata]
MVRMILNTDEGFLWSLRACFAIGGLFCGLVAHGLTSNDLHAQSASYERPPIDYINAPVSDEVSVLGKQISAGEVELEYDPKFGYLPAVLKALDIPLDSQVLVFSKTSLQLHRIAPGTPRAIYFNDNVYVGYCHRGDALEIAVTDPQQGAIFYTIRQRSSDTPRLLRDRGQCLTCHATNRTQGVPGYLIRSVYSDNSGHPIFSRGTFTTDHASPFIERWGGWYVTGEHGQMRHMGNVTTSDDEAMDYESGANRTTLEGLVDTDPYPSPHSDIVALMVLEHQTQVHNALTFANFETREALHQSYTMNALLERDPDHISESAQRRMTKAVEKLVQQLLLCDEFGLESPVTGTSTFASEFAKRGPTDPSGRSLRDLDLKTRLFRYPCSFLIYSPAFRELPPEVHQRAVSRIQEVLTATEPEEAFAHLSADDRKAILEILVATHADFAERN